MVGVFGALVLVVVLLRWVCLEPAMPNIPLNIDEKQAGLILSRYKDLQTANLESAIKIIDAIVVKILLPVFTSFVGYVFGSQVTSKSQ